MTINSRSHLQSLDGLRGIAILLVFLFHYFPRDRHDPLSLVASFGWSGVDLFFVLSGFLITGILLDTREFADRFKSFYMRRILRLFPVYFLAIAVVIVGTHFLRGFRSWMDIPFFFYGSNIVEVLPNSISVFPPYFNCQHFWSLALEEQFYSIWPFIVFFVPKRRTLIRVCVSGILLALAIRIVAAVFGASEWATYMQLPTRMDSLLMGGLLAILVRGADSHRWLDKRRLKWIFGAGCVALAVVLAVAKTFWLSVPMNTVGFSILAVTCAAVVASSLIPGTLSYRIGSLGILRFFGRYSYGLYIWHALFVPVSLGWSDRFRQIIHPQFLADLIYFTCLLAVFTALAVLSYTQFEARFLRLKSRFQATPKRSSVDLAAS